MDIVLLDKNFIPVYVVDSYESFIWTDRYSEPGDFEYYNLANEEILNTFKIGYYLINSESDHTMIVESIETESDAENGDHVRITGRSIESLLERRLVWSQTIINGNLQSGLKKIFNNNIISPSVTKRKIDNFIFVDSNDKRITDLKLEAQYTGDVILTVVNDICASEKMGYKLILEDKKFYFGLYFGTDRSDAQNELPKVTFGFDYDNVINMDYTEDYKTERNVALVAGEGEGTARVRVTVGDAEGIERKELYVDARDLSKEIEGGGTLSDAEYQRQLKQRGQEQLSEATAEKNFEGEVDAENLFKYNRDFVLGDIVNFYDKFGNKRRVRVNEMIFNETTDGTNVYPSFVVLDEEVK